MRRFLRALAAPALLVLAMGATLLAPTSASARGEHRDRVGYSRSWDEDGSRSRYRRPYYGERSYWDEDDARPRRRYHTEESRRRAAQAQRQKRHAKQKRERQIARQQQSRRMAHKRAGTRQAAKPSKRWPPPVMGSHGIASYYWQPQRVAAGGWFDPNAMTAAHRTLPFGTRVRVKHLSSGRTVEVQINDRGPYIAGRIIDLSKAAAGVIGMTQQGIARVAVEILGR